MTISKNVKMWQRSKGKSKHGRGQTAAVNYVVNRTLYYTLYYVISFNL